MPVSRNCEIYGPVGIGLVRPECALAHHSGLIVTPSWKNSGGISLISPTGNTHHLLSNYHFPLRPNGIALEDNGSVLLAHLGDTQGGVYRLFSDGQVEAVATHADKQPLPPTNYIVKDSSQRLWITVSTRKTPRSADYKPTACTGFIAVLEPGAEEATIVADGLGYTNECVIDERNQRVWVNETFARRLSCFDIAKSSNGQLSLQNQRTVCRFGPGTYPDGLAMDEAGYLWITSIVSNRIIGVSPEGQIEPFFEDSDPHHLSWTENAFKAGKLGREHLDTSASKRMKNISNIAFGGKHRDRIYLGNLLGDSLHWLPSPVRGAEMPHWQCPLGDLEAYL